MYINGGLFIGVPDDKHIQKWGSLGNSNKKIGESKPRYEIDLHGAFLLHAIRVSMDLRVAEGGRRGQPKVATPVYSSTRPIKRDA